MGGPRGLGTWAGRARPLPSSGPAPLAASSPRRPRSGRRSSPSRSSSTASRCTSGGRSCGHPWSSSTRCGCGAAGPWVRILVCGRYLWASVSSSVQGGSQSYSQLPGLLEKWKKEVARSQGKMSTVSDFRHSWVQPPSCHLLTLPTARVGFVWWCPTLLPLTKVAAAAPADTQGEGLVLTGRWARLSIPEPITVAGGQARLGP